MDYKTIYNKLVDTRKKLNRKRNDGGVYEIHHIVPKSMGGSNDKDNLILFTPREHFIAHRLLEKITKNTKHHYKMLKAVYMMSQDGATTRHTPKARVYENIRCNYLKRNKLLFGKQVLQGAVSITNLYKYYTHHINEYVWRLYSKEFKLPKDLKEGFKNSLKVVIVMLRALHSKGYTKVSGFKVAGNNVADILIEWGYIERVGHKQFKIKDVFIELCNKVKAAPSLKPLYSYCIEDGVVKSAQGVGTHKKFVKKHNTETTSGDMLRLVFIDNEYVKVPL